MAIVNAFEVAPVTSTPKTETLIQFVLDETGSMSWCKAATISSFNEYIGSQRTVNDGLTCSVSLNKFSDVGGIRMYSGSNDYKKPSAIRNVYDSVDIQNVQPLTESSYMPNGGTNLYDAIGETIAHLDRTVKDSQNVLVVIMTDGAENASREYTAQQIKSLITERQAKGWTFVYLGANQDAWSVGSTLGLAKGQTMSYSVSDMKGTMETLGTATSMYRNARGLYAGQNAAVGTEMNFFDNKESN